VGMRALGFPLFEFSRTPRAKDYHEQKCALPSTEDIMVEVHSNARPPFGRRSAAMSAPATRDVPFEAGQGRSFPAATAFCFCCCRPMARRGPHQSTAAAPPST